MPTEKAQLEQHLGFQLKSYQLPNWAKFRGDHNSRSCLCDEAGSVVGLILRATDLPITLEIPAYLTALVYCCISDNKKLEGINFETALPNLEYLDVSDCQELRDLNLPEGFEKLERLDAHNTKLRNIEGLEGSCPSLKSLDLNINGMRNFEVPKIEDFPDLEYLYLHERSLNHSLKVYKTKNTHSNFLPAIKELKEALKSGKAQENKDFKVMLVGDGKTGKTCLVKGLIDKEFPEEWDSTHGISVRRYESKEIEYTIIFWDFGGQDIYHATHRLFMQQDTVYLLLWNKEIEREDYTQDPNRLYSKGFKNHHVAYWLKYIRYMAGESPVVVAQTRSNPRNPRAEHRDWHDFKNQFQPPFPMLENLHIDAKLEHENKDGGFKKLKRLIEDAITKFARIEYLPERWIKIKEAFLQEYDGHKATAKDNYIVIAERFGETNPEALLKNWLVETGIVFYKEDLFDNQIILDQEWAIKAIYVLFKRDTNGPYQQIIHQDGQFTGKDLHKFWAKEPYTIKEKELFVSLMLTCQMIFRISTKDNDNNKSFEEQEFIAIELLPEDKRPKTLTQLEKFWKKYQEPLLQIKYTYTFWHHTVLQSFIARTYKFFDVEDLYKKGVLVKDEEENAIIEACKKEDAILVTLPKKDLSLLNKIRNLFKDIHRSEEEYSEFVRLYDKPFVAMEELRKVQKDNKDSVKDKDGNYVDVTDYQIFLDLDEKDKFEDLPKEEIRLEEQTTIPPIEKETPMNKIQELVSKNRLREALTELTKTNDSKEIPLLKQRLTALESEKRKGVLSTSEYNLERNKITDSILSLPIEPESEIDIGAFSNNGDTESPINSSKTYISYAWGGDSSSIADKIEKELTAKGIAIYRDLSKVGYKDSIKDFMDAIGKGNRLIVIISKKYLESDNCMYELTQIYENNNFKERIFPIVLADANIYKPIARIKYIKFWDEKIKELNEAIKSIDTGFNLTEIQQELNGYVNIRSSFDKMAAVLKDMNALNPEIHQNENFESLYNSLNS